MDARGAVHLRTESGGEARTTGGVAWRGVAGDEGKGEVKR